jgi:protein-S-isoprenylcysteine O-methyltransferase Ste14
MAFETVANWIVIAGSAVLFTAIVVSWLASYRAPKSAPVGSSKWFALPAWAQIGGGLAAIALLILLGDVLWIPLPFDPSPGVSLVLRVVGLGLFLVGLLLVLWARWALGAMYGVSTSSAAQLHAQHRLIQHGPYAFVRHPMYLGYWLVFAGAVLAYRTWMPLVFLMMFLPLYRRARREEAALAERFGAEWQAYAARTKFLIPFAW